MIMLFFAMLFGALILQSASAAPAQADEVGTEYDFYFAV